MNKEELRAQHKALTLERNAQTDRLAETRRELDLVANKIAALACPVRVGDAAVTTSGPDEGKTWAISRVCAFSVDRPDSYMVYGFVIKKDGKPGTLERRIYNPERLLLLDGTD